MTFSLSPLSLSLSLSFVVVVVLFNRFARELVVKFSVHCSGCFFLKSLLKEIFPVWPFVNVMLDFFSLS